CLPYSCSCTFCRTPVVVWSLPCFFFQCSGDHRDLHSFPTRRSSDLITLKADASPLTEADLAAHHVIVDGLRALSPELPVLSEESDRKSTRLNSSHVKISYAVFCLKKKKLQTQTRHTPGDLRTGHQPT